MLRLAESELRRILHIRLHILYGCQHRHSSLDILQNHQHTSYVAAAFPIIIIVYQIQRYRVITACYLLYITLPFLFFHFSILLNLLYILFKLSALPLSLSSVNLYRSNNINAYMLSVIAYQPFIFRLVIM